MPDPNNPMANITGMNGPVIGIPNYAGPIQVDFIRENIARIAMGIDALLLCPCGGGGSMGTLFVETRVADGLAVQTLTNTPLNAILIFASDGGVVDTPGIDYTVAGANVTYGVAPVIGNTLVYAYFI